MHTKTILSELPNFDVAQVYEYIRKWGFSIQTLSHSLYACVHNLLCFFSTKQFVSHKHIERQNFKKENKSINLTLFSHMQMNKTQCVYTADCLSTVRFYAVCTVYTCECFKGITLVFDVSPVRQHRTIRHRKRWNDDVWAKNTHIILIISYDLIILLLL